MGSHDQGSELQLAALGVREVSAMRRDSTRTESREAAVLLFCSSNQLEADELLDHVVTSCHGTFVGVDLRHELAQRISKGSLSPTAYPFLAFLKATFWVLRSHQLMTSNGHLRSLDRDITW